jgi:hypothetical protein
MVEVVEEVVLDVSGRVGRGGGVTVVVICGVLLSSVLVPVVLKDAFVAGDTVMD